MPTATWLASRTVPPSLQRKRLSLAVELVSNPAVIFSERLQLNLEGLARVYRLGGCLAWMPGCSSGLHVGAAHSRLPSPLLKHNPFLPASLAVDEPTSGKQC